MSFSIFCSSYIPQIPYYTPFLELCCACSGSLAGQLLSFSYYAVPKLLAKFQLTNDLTTSMAESVAGCPNKASLIACLHAIISNRPEVFYSLVATFPEKNLRQELAKIFDISDTNIIRWVKIDRDFFDSLLTTIFSDHFLTVNIRRLIAIFKEYGRQDLVDTILHNDRVQHLTGFIFDWGNPVQEAISTQYCSVM